MIPKRKVRVLKSNLTRIESRAEVESYIARLKYALEHGGKINFQTVRKVDNERNAKFTNSYTIDFLFPNENIEDVFRRELRTLSCEEYLRTVKDIRFPKRSEMREFGRIYNGNDEIYIKIRVELLDSNYAGQSTTFVMSFHFAEKSFKEEFFPYRTK